jgi:hexosaminidase
MTMKRRDFLGTAAGAAALTTLRAKGLTADKARKPGARPGAELPAQSPETAAFRLFEPPAPSGPAVQLRLEGEVRDLLPGVELLAPELNFRLSPKGMPVKVSRIKQNLLRVRKKGRKAEIHYNQKSHFFRGLGLLLQEAKAGKDFETTEEPQFTTCGAMFDVSQSSAVIDLPGVKLLVRMMAVMGLNMLMLYCEDSYVLEGQPYFGYMRGKYSQDDFREVDRYAALFGIEAVPCIETLAHLTDALQWDVYQDIREDADTLLPGSDKTYAFVERLIGAASAPFQTKRIHIGMDEAWKLGQGNYLKLHGLRKKIDIMTEHLSRVLEITDRLGLRPMIWSDMYFRAASKTGDYYDESSAISPDDIAKMPKNVQFVYWDYYHNEPGFYTEWIKRHKEFGSDPIFAGGIWGWQGYGLQYGKTFVTTNAGLGACKAAGVKEVFATIWGDATTESNIYAHILGLQLYAEHAFSRDLDEDRLKERFAFCTGCRYEDFWDLNSLNAVPSVDRNSAANPSRFLMWQDLLMGLFDKNIEGLPLENHYTELARKMGTNAARNGRFNFLFEFYTKVCAVLATKSELGLKLRRAYLAKDTGALKAISSETLPLLAARVAALRENHRALWLAIDQPPGWEVLEVRYGGLLARINTVRWRIDEYLAGRLPRIAELEQDRLPWQGKEGLNDLVCNSYDRMVSASRLAFSWKM